MDLLFIIPISIIIALIHHLDTQQDRSVLKPVALKYNLKYRCKFLFRRASITGKVSNYNFKAKIVKSNKTKYLKMEMEYSGKKKFKMFVIKRDTFLNMKKFFGLQKDVEVGDELFDKKYVIDSEVESAMIILLNENIRGNIDVIDRTAIDFQITDESIDADYYYEAIEDPANLINKIETQKDIADRINNSESFKDLLIDNIKNETHPIMQTKNFDLLVGNYKKDEKINNLFSWINQSQSLHLKMLVGKYLGKKGKSFLLKALKDYDYSTIDDLTINEMIEIIEVLSDFKIEADYNILIELCNNYNNEKLLVSVIKAIGTLQLNIYEDFILSHINTDQKTVMEEILNFLSECGTRKSIEVLRHISEKTLNPLKKSKIQNVISKIKSRLGNVEKGWVSVPEQKDLDGALSKESVDKKGLLSREEV